MNTIDFIGYFSACLTTLAFVPQAYHSWKTRDLSGVSLPMYTLFSIGVAGWLSYGILINSWPIIAANSITLLLACVVLYLKLSHKKSTIG
jgi:MtN3 and saliva related transmembrane protein